MPPKRTGSTSDADDDGMTHLFGCTGTAPDGSPCPAWVPTWLPKRVPRGFMERPILCGFCAAAQVAQLKATTFDAKPDDTSKLFSLLQSDANEQYGRRDNIRIFGLDEAKDENPYDVVVHVAKLVRVNIKKTDISVCHRLPSRRGKKPLIVKFVRRETKFEIMRNKKKLKEGEHQIYINDDLTPLRSKISAKLREIEDMKTVVMQNEKITLYDIQGKKTVFNNLAEVYKWNPALVMSSCKESRNF